MTGGRASRFPIIFVLCLAAGVFVFNLAITATISRAASLSQAPQPTGEIQGEESDSAVNPLSISDEVCLECHGEPGLEMTLENGETWELYVNPEEHANSIHGELGYACVQCHRSVGNYPHPPFSASDQRDATLQLNTACQYCHTHQAELNLDGVHAAALAEGKREAAVCVDCHGSHTVQRIYDPDTGEILPDARQWIPQTCAQCHSAIYEKYHDSVHGSALTEEGNPDVPTCIDCHGVHNIPDPTTAEFRLNSPEICAKCHTDPQVMTKYGISTQVMDTYVADFHGTTQVLFHQENPEQQFNKPVCFDCHGVHDIARADDPEKGLLVRKNLLLRCQVCHPDATENFPDAWLSHYIPSPEKYPVVYYVNLFYKFLIPTILGGMGLLVVLDISKRARDWLGTQDKIRFPSLAKLKNRESDFQAELIDPSANEDEPAQAPGEGDISSTGFSSEPGDESAQDG